MDSTGPPITFAHAASRASTTARAIFFASACDLHVTITTILSVIRHLF